MPPEATPADQPRSTGSSTPGTTWRRALDWLVFALAGSGAAWLVAQRVLAAPTEFGTVAPAWAAKALALHGGAAMLALVVIGAWLPAHVLPRMARAPRRWTGVLQLGLCAVLAITGFGLYYLADETTRPAWSLVHWACGLGWPVLLLVHRHLRSP